MSKGAELTLRTTWHDPKRRRLEAMRACQERDFETLVDLLDTYLSYRSKKKARTSLHTRSTYELGLRTFLEFCWPSDSPAPLVNILQATVDDIDLWIAELQGRKSGRTGKPLSPSTIQTYLASVRTLYKALQWCEATDRDPASATHAPSDPRPRHERRPALEVDVYKNLCDELERSREPLDMRNSLIVRLFGDTALRVSEILALNVEDVDLKAGEHGAVFIRKAKGGKAQTKDLTKQASRAMFRWLGYRGAYAKPKERALIVNVGPNVQDRHMGKRISYSTVNRLLNGLYDELGVHGRIRGTHTLRHTAGTRFYRLTGDIYATQEFMGHSNVQTTTIYAKMDAATVRRGVAAMSEDD